MTDEFVLSSKLAGKIADILHDRDANSVYEACKVWWLCRLLHRHQADVKTIKDDLVRIDTALKDEPAGPNRLFLAAMKDTLIGENARHDDAINTLVVKLGSATRAKMMSDIMPDLNFWVIPGGSEEDEPADKKDSG